MVPSCAQKFVWGLALVMTLGLSVRPAAASEVKEMSSADVRKMFGTRCGACHGDFGKKAGRGGAPAGRHANDREAGSRSHRQRRARHHAEFQDNADGRTDQRAGDLHQDASGQVTSRNAGVAIDGACDARAAMMPPFSFGLSPNSVDALQFHSGTEATVLAVAEQFIASAASL